MTEIPKAAKRFDLIETKLKAIREKDVGNIVAKRTYIPFMGRAGIDKFKDSQLTIGAVNISDWLEVRAKVLEDAKKLPEAEIQARINALSETLCETCKKLVSLAEPRSIEKPCAKNYETVCKIRLYQFSLGETI